MVKQVYLFDIFFATYINDDDNDHDNDNDTFKVAKHRWFKKKRIKLQIYLMTFYSPCILIMMILMT